MKSAFWNTLLLCFGIYSIALFGPPANGFATVSQDPCPDYVGPGRKWFLEWSCIMCQCSEEGQGYTCYGCSPMGMIANNSICYIELVDPKARYPGCCAQHILCPGDLQYNASMVQHSVG